MKASPTMTADEEEEWARALVAGELFPQGEPREANHCPSCGVEISEYSALCRKCRWPDADKHGTKSRYVRGCRCRPCTEAATAYERKRLARRRTR